MSFNNSKSEEKSALEKVIKKSRIHLYKPIQIAEILHRDRIYSDINLQDLDTYRNTSKKWRDEVSSKLVGRTSTSSQKFQDNLFEENALPPRLIVKLGETNRAENGSVEKYIYQQFRQKFSQMIAALDYCNNAPRESFRLNAFLDLFRNDPGLKRSVDKIYEIVVYALFSALIDEIGIDISIKIKDINNPILSEFADFSEKILGITKETQLIDYPAKLFRVGITNAADRGLDMWGNFGLAIQIKHLSLTEEVAHDVSRSINADRIIIVCKDADEKIITSLLGQLGWRSRIQAIITFGELKRWYQKALQGNYGHKIGDNIISTLKVQIKLEFPSSENNFIAEFFSNRNY